MARPAAAATAATAAELTALATQLRDTGTADVAIRQLDGMLRNMPDERAALPGVVAVLLACRDTATTSLNKALVAWTTRVLGALATSVEALPPQDSTELIRVLVPLCDCTTGVDFTILNSVWRCIARALAVLLKQPCQSPQQDVKELLACIVRGCTESLAWLHAAGDAKGTTNKALGLLRFFLANLASMMKLGVAVPEEERVPLIECITRTRACLPPCHTTTALFTPDTETLLKQVAMGLDFVVTSLVSPTLLSSEQRLATLRGFSAAATSSSAAHVDDLGRLQFLLVILHNWQNTRLTEIANADDAQHCLMAVLTLAARLDPATRLPGDTVLAGDHLHWHACTILAASAVTLLSPDGVANFQARLLRDALSAALPTASLAIDTYVLLVRQLGRSACVRAAQLLFELTVTISSSSPPMVARRVRRPLLLATLSALLQSLPDDDVVRILQTGDKKSSVVPAAIIFEIILRRPAPLSAALSTILRSVHDHVLSKLLLALDANPTDSVPLCRDLACIRLTVSETGVDHADVLTAQGRLVAVYRRLLALVRASNVTTSAGWLDAWLAWAATFAPVLRDNHDIIVALFSSAATAAVSAQDTVRHALAKFITAAAHLHYNEAKIADIVPPLHTIVSAALSQPHRIGRIESIRQFVYFSERHATQPAIVEAVLAEEYHIAVVQAIQGEPSMELSGDATEVQLWPHANVTPLVDAASRAPKRTRPLSNCEDWIAVLNRAQTAIDTMDPTMLYNLENVLQETLARVRTVQKKHKNI